MCQSGRPNAAKPGRFHECRCQIGHRLDRGVDGGLAGQLLRPRGIFSTCHGSKRIKGRLARLCDIHDRPAAKRKSAARSVLQAVAEAEGLHPVGRDVEFEALELAVPQIGDLRTWLQRIDGFGG